ncbi:MAG: hypothetical protein KGD70_13855 [Candidatus Lokiarchaeota archaeon]|nr:hypothetical protein [Candidatus Lokiarchaeota archaeon]
MRIALVIPSVVYALGLTKAEVDSFIEQENVPSPLVLGMLVRPAKAEDFFLTSEIFFNNPKLWKTASEDIPVLVRIINKTKK